MNLSQLELEEMVSYRKNVTGVDHTLFISPKGNAQHAPRIKVATDPPDSLDPRGETASISFSGKVVDGDIDPKLLRQIKRFIQQNHKTLVDYWFYQIDTHQLQQRLKAVK